MIDSLQNFATQFPDWLQWFAVVLLSAIPFVESYLGSVIGVLAGLHVTVAVSAAVVGNILSMIGFVYGAQAIRNRKVDPDAPLTARQAKVKRTFDKWGVPGVSLLGQTMLPSQLTSAAMVGFGASRRAVIIWQSVSITLWGVGFGLLTAGFVGL